MTDLITVEPTPIEAADNDPVSVLGERMRDARREHERRLAGIHYGFVLDSYVRVCELHRVLDALWDDFTKADVELSDAGLSDAGNKAFKKSSGDITQLANLLSAGVESLAAAGGVDDE